MFGSLDPDLGSISLGGNKCSHGKMSAMMILHTVSAALKHVMCIFSWDGHLVTCVSLVIIIPLPTILDTFVQGETHCILFIPSSGRQTRSLRSNMKRTETERLGKGCYIGGGFTICGHHNKQGCDVWQWAWPRRWEVLWRDERYNFLRDTENSWQPRRHHFNNRKTGENVFYDDYITLIIPSLQLWLCRYLLLLLPLSISGYWNEPGCLVKLKCPELSTSPPHCTCTY